MGLVSKHGILIVQFANELQRGGKAKREAIEEAAAVRLRPILMTTAAMVLGVVPLVIAAGAGAAGRHAMGLVIFTGLVDRHAVHAVRRAGGVHAVGGGSSSTAQVPPCARRASGRSLGSER